MFFDILYIQILTYREEQNSPINNRNRGIGILYKVGLGVPGTGSVHLILDNNLILSSHWTVFFTILYIKILTYREEQNRPINNRNRGIGILYSVGLGVPGSVHLI